MFVKPPIITEEKTKSENLSNRFEYLSSFERYEKSIHFNKQIAVTLIQDGTVAKKPLPVFPLKLLQT